jgi:long-chain acyl-CoA synthetase
MPQAGRDHNRRESIGADAHESLALYESLVLEALDVCVEISRYPMPSDPSALKTWEVAKAFAECGSIPRSASHPHAIGGAAFEALDKLRADWPQLHSGEMTGEIVYASAGDLWRRLMCEPPMGTYATLAASVVNSSLNTVRTIIELGAGVGNTSRLLEIPEGVRYLRSDKNPSLLTGSKLPGTPVRYDFDLPSSMSDADLVFAVNAVHCAQDPRRTLSFVRDILRPGGMLLLAEGAPRPSGNRPWALDVLFCQFQGWWDRSGFRDRAAWIDDLRAAGYVEVGCQRLLADEYDLGGLIYARR